MSEVMSGSEFRNLVDIANRQIQDRLDNEWIVNVFGAVGGSHEISVVRKSFEHGRKSWGWGDEDRKIVISVSVHNDGFKDPHLWDALIGLAHSYASHLNAKDSGK